MNAMETLQSPKSLTLLRMAIAVYVVWVAILAGLALTSSEKPPEARQPATSR